MGEKRGFLLMRWGGMGDAMFMTPVARELHKRGYAVDVCTHENAAKVFKGNPYVREVMVAERWGPMQRVQGDHPVNLIKRNGVWVPDVILYENYPSERPLRRFNVADYFRSIEDCSLHSVISRSQASDYANTYDLHLGWAGIDPTTVDDKSPDWFLSDRERHWAEKHREEWGPYILLQPFASSPARSYMRISPIMQYLREKELKVLLWHPGHLRWELDGIPIPTPEGMDGYRLTGALISQADLLISADTFVSHVAEAQGIPHITFYSSVPAWTRSCYYNHEITIDLRVEDEEGQPCKCCIIGRDCPRIKKAALELLSEQERELLSILPPNLKQQHGIEMEPIDIGQQTPWEYFGSASPHGFQALQEAALRRYDALQQMEAPCIASLDLLEHVKEYLEGGG